VESSRLRAALRTCAGWCSNVSGTFWLSVDKFLEKMQQIVPTWR